MDFSLGELFSTTVKLFALLTPPAVLSGFLGSTRHYDSQRKQRTALRTGSAVFIMGTVLYFFGDSLFSLFGFTLDAFRIGAGILLFLTAVSLMNPPGESHTAEHEDEDISIVPLAIPLCLGPASIGTLMVLGASAKSFGARMVGFVALAIAALLITLMLLAADRLQALLGRTGLAVLAKLTGLLLAAIAAQVVFTGIKNIMHL